MDDLRTRVQALPAELFERIREIFFTPKSGEQEICKDCRPPKPLQIDSKSRETFAKGYYGGGRSFVFNQPYLMEKWIRALQTQYRALLQHVCFILEDPQFERCFTPPFNVSVMVRQVERQYHERGGLPRTLPGSIETMLSRRDPDRQADDILPRPH